MAHRSAKHFV